MGGSSKPEDPKVTPYQEPAAPTNPIPNFFGGQTGGGYKPNTGASEQAFTMPQPMQQAAAQPMQQPMQGMTGGMGQPMQQEDMDQSYRGGNAFSIPTRQYGGPRNAGNNSFMAGGNFGPMFGGGDMRANMERIASDPNGFQDRILGMFKGGINGLQNAPRLQNLMGSFGGQTPAPSWSQYGQVPEQQNFKPSDVYGVRPGVDRRY
jgi:hypothetical protein